VSDAKRVLHVKGRRSVRATEVELSWKAFNQGDVFIIEIENVRRMLLDNNLLMELIK